MPWARLEPLIIHSRVIRVHSRGQVLPSHTTTELHPFASCGRRSSVPSNSVARRALGVLCVVASCGSSGGGECHLGGTRQAQLLICTRVHECRAAFVLDDSEFSAMF